MSAAKLTILSVAYPFAPVGPRAVGGAERILTELDAALVEAGHRSLVVARSDSESRGRVFGTPVGGGAITPGLRLEVESAHQHSLDRALASERVDLVHMHGLDFNRYTVPENVPVLVTLHMPPSWYPAEIWKLPAQYTLQCVSHSQRAECPTAASREIPVIENGVVIPELSERRKGRFALMLSRVCPEKNLHLGLDAARLSGMPVLLAGEVFPYREHIRYFEEEICPRLGRGARFLGPVCGAAKQRLLERARCLLQPSLAPETSSLVAMEALAAGTPVCALRSGAVPEIVDDGVTGLLVENEVAAMAAGITAIGRISPGTCRSVAASRFALSRMVAGYFATYAGLCDAERRKGPAMTPVHAGTA